MQVFHPQTYESCHQAREIWKHVRATLTKKDKEGLCFALAQRPSKITVPLMPSILQPTGHCQWQQSGKFVAPLQSTLRSGQ